VVDVILAAVVAWRGALPAVEIAGLELPAFLAVVAAAEASFG
jgi:hypothetical protein